MFAARPQEGGTENIHSQALQIPQNLRPEFLIAAKRSHFRVALSIGTSPPQGITSTTPHYELLNQTNAVLNEQVEQKPELEIREAGTNCGDADR
jgi:hypothetical protein